MATATLSLEGLALTVGRSLASLQDSLKPENATLYFRSLGIGFSDLTANAVVSGALDATSTSVGNLSAAAENLGALVDAGSENTIQIVALGALVLGAIGEVTSRFGDLRNAFLAQKTALGVDPAFVETFVADLPDRLLSAGVIQFAETKTPGLALLFSSFGIFERFDDPGVLGDPTRPSFTFRGLNLGRIVDAIADPAGLLSSIYGFGGVDFGNPGASAQVNGLQMIQRLASALEAGGFPAVALFDVDPNFPALNSEILRVTINPDIGGLRLEFSFPVPSPQTFSVPLTQGWSATGTVTGDGLSGVGIDIAPPDQLSVTPVGGSVFNARFSVGVTGTPPSGQKFVLLGVTGGSRLEVDSIGLGLGFELAFDVATGSATGTPFVAAELGGGRVVLDLSAGDGFTKSLTGGPLETAFDLKVNFSLATGIRLEGGAFEVNLPIHVEFAGIKLNGLKIGLPLGQAGGGLPIDFSTSLAATFGPFSMVLDQIGLATKLTFGGGRLGIGDFTAGFKAPTGIGVSIDGGAVSGGGFIAFEEATGRYSGALELRVFSVGVKAFGVLDTRFPDGTEGVSFVVVIVAEFTPIQLGFGFTLLGVGGLLGLNRSMNEQALGDAVRTGSLAHLLFPRNPVQDAPAIIHDLATVFPASRGHYIFGPMAKLGWGTPTLISADLGIVIEFPGPRLAVLGVVRMLLPSPEFALLRFQLAVLGLLDFPARTFSLDASLFDSTVAGYVVTGDMAYRLGFGANASFLLSVGGFNPGFQAPPAFPELRRASVDLGVSGNPSLVASGYFALTSNTAQIGAKIELRASGFGIRLEGHLGFDVLFVFSPFSFTASISAGVRVSFHGVGFGITLRGSLSGPTPWHVKGRVCVSVLWWDACLPIDVKFGRAEPAALPEMDPWEGTPPVTPPEVVDPRVQVLGLRDAIVEPRNWSGSAPPAGFSVVSLAEAATAERTPIDPLGAATLRQKVVPLRRDLEKFGEYKPIAHTRFDSVAVAINDVPESNVSFVEDKFAPAHFTEFSGAQRLSMPSYELMDAGFSIAPDRVTAGSVGSATLEYETAFITAAGERFADAPGDVKFKLTHEQLLAQLERSASALGGMRRAGTQRFMLPLERPKKVVLARETFVVADSCSHVKHAATGTYTSRSQALLALRAHERSNPTDVNRFDVIPGRAVRAA
jgi:hypothetical protein